MKFAVIGSGAIGCFYGSKLVRAGEDARFLFRSDYAQVKERGLSIRSCDGDYHLRVNAYDDARKMPKVDVAIVAVKGFDTPALRALLPPILDDATNILSLQNGFGNEEKLAAWFGAERVIAGTAFICSEKIAPGVVSHTSAGTVRLARFDPSSSHGVSPEEIAARFGAAGVKCGVDADPKRIKWIKLIWNIPFSGLAIHFGGATTDRILAAPEKLRFARGLMEEVIAAAAADGVTLDRSLVETNIAATEKMGAYRPSMLVDFLNGRPLEVDEIFAEPLARGERGGASLPLLRELLEGVRAAISARRAERPAAR